MMFSDLYFLSDSDGTVYARHFFPNGYGVSIVCETEFDESESLENQSFRMTILKGTERNWTICLQNENDLYSGFRVFRGLYSNEIEYALGDIEQLE